MVPGAVLAACATVDTPLIPVTSRAVIARTEIFFRSIIVFSTNHLSGCNIWNVQAGNILESRQYRELNISKNDIFDFRYVSDCNPKSVLPGENRQGRVNGQRKLEWIYQEDLERAAF